MSEPRSFRIFLSAVTKELGSCRIGVARALRRKGLEVRDQEHFRQGPATLLEQLRDYIRQCDAVILLVGDRCGDFPTADHAAALGDLPLLQKYRTAASQDRVSYTQWEFLLAKHHGRDTYIFFTAPGFQPDEPNPEDAALQTCQADFRMWVKSTGKHRDTLTTQAKLIEDVLVLPFPDLGRPKPISLPYHSLGTLFKGRDEFLVQLRKSLERAVDGHATAIVGKAIHGLGGVGKTRLAVEYAWQHQDAYTALLFVPADSPEALRRNLAGLCGPLVLDLPEQDRPEEEAKLAAALRWLHLHPGWFLILDNLDTPDAAAEATKLLAQLHGGQVLLTSRQPNWSGQVVSLELDVLTETAAADFLCARTDARRRKQPDDDAQARALALELGQLALALEQAGAYIAKHRLTFGGYLKEWRDRHDRVLTWFDEQLMHYPRSVATTWQTSFDQLSEPARRLLHLVAWLAPDPIPESLLDVPVPGAADADLHDGLVNLEAYSLVTRAPDAPVFSVHRLVQDVTRRSLADDKEQHDLNAALRWVNAAFIGDPTDVRAWPILVPLAPHARAVIRRADEAGVTEPTARLMNDVGLLLKEKALHTEAEALYRRALAIDERSFGADHPKVAIRLNNLASLLQATNRLGEAEPLMRRALAIDERSFGADHPNVAMDLNNLARLLQATNRLADAEPLMRRAVGILFKFTHRTGHEHPHLQVICANYRAILESLGRNDAEIDAEFERLKAEHQ